jgi:pyrroline-5-carboxylate reductase
MKLAFIGGGNMATALIGGILGRGVSPAAVRVAEVVPEARERLHASFGVTAVASAAEAADGADCIVFAVKPQQMPAVAPLVAQAARQALVVSIAAGIRTADLARWLGGHERIVRVMPNTPALVGAGVSALYALPAVGAAEREAVEGLFRAVGKTLWVSQEGLIDAVTAVSGSGPAYAFYLIESMEQAALQLGFDAQAARLLSVETVLGAAKLAEASPERAEVLRARVTSKGGTTERALAVLEGHAVKQHFVEAILAAEARSRELGDAAGKG